MATVRCCRRPVSIPTRRSEDGRCAPDPARSEFYGKKLYAVRDSGGRFKDIQTYERAHRADLKKYGEREPAQRARAARQGAVVAADLPQLPEFLANRSSTARGLRRKVRTAMRTDGSASGAAIAVEVRRSAVP